MKGLFYILLCLIFCLPKSGQAQLQLFEYFYNYPEGPSRLVALNDGGWIVVLLESQPIGSIRHNLVLSRYDPCGEIIDRNSLHFPGSLQLSVAGVYEDIDDSFWMIFVGRQSNSNYAGLLCHFDALGNLLENRFITSGEGYIPYTVNRNAAGDLAIFGNVVGTGSSNSSIITFDDQLEVTSSKRILGTGSWGTFLPTSDGGYICRSGTTYYKIDASYQQEWVQRVPRYYATNVPLEVSDGYVFSVYTYSSNTDQNFLLKFGLDGELIWQSPNLLNEGFTRIKFLSNGNIMQIGMGLPEDGLMRHVVFSEVGLGGDIVRQKAFNPDLTLGFRGDDFIERENGSFVFLGRTDDFSRTIQSLTTPRFGLFCGDYNYAMFESANIVEFLPPENISSADIVVQSTEIDTLLMPAFFSEDRICFENLISLPELPGDTSLCEGDSLRIDLRFVEDDILWSDGSTEKFRMLSEAGEYEVTAMRCSQSISRTISIESKDCSCTFYMPNVFTPNDDGQNDELKLFSTCPFESCEMQVFDRWGSLMYQSNDINGFWDGRNEGRFVSAGVYIVNMECSVIENGQLQSHRFVKDITVIR